MVHLFRLYLTHPMKFSKFRSLLGCTYAFLNFFQNCVGCSRLVFWSYKGFKCILSFSETIFGIRRKTESDEQKISIFKNFSRNDLRPSRYTQALEGETSCKSVKVIFSCQKEIHQESFYFRWSKIKHFDSQSISYRNSFLELFNFRWLEIRR